MSQHFQNCLDRGKIKEFSRGKNLTSKEVRLAEEDLKTAQLSLKDKNYRWAIVQVYYSMFHSARALLFHKNYREHSHFCLIEAIRALYVEKGELNVFFIEALVEAKNLREAADYYGEYSEINTRKLLERARGFIDHVKTILF